MKLSTSSFHTKKLKTLNEASFKARKDELLSDLYLEKQGRFWDILLNQKLAQAYHNLVQRLQHDEHFNIKEYKIAHRFIGSTARELPRDTIDQRVKKELVQLLEEHNIYPYTT